MGGTPILVHVVDELAHELKEDIARRPAFLRAAPPEAPGEGEEILRKVGERQNHVDWRMGAISANGDGERNVRVGARENLNGV